MKESQKTYKEFSTVINGKTIKFYACSNDGGKDYKKKVEYFKSKQWKPT